MSMVYSSNYKVLNIKRAIHMIYHEYTVLDVHQGYFVMILSIRTVTVEFSLKFYETWGFRTFGENTWMEWPEIWYTDVSRPLSEPV